MFNIFNKKSELHEDNREVLASITYLVKRDTKDVMIDVQIDDFDEASTDALGSILEVLGQDMCYIDTVNIIKELFTKQDKHTLLISIFSKMEQAIREKIIASAKNRLKDEPFIKPSEMFR